MVQRPTERKCVLCGRPLSIYNPDDTCHFHNVPVDKKPKPKNTDSLHYFKNFIHVEDELEKQF